MQSTGPKLVLLVFGIFSLSAAPSVATDRSVPGQYATVSAAVNASQQGDRVLVSPGTYTEFGIALKAGLTIEGLGGSPADVVINGANQGRLLRAINLTSSAAVTNLTLRGGNAFGASYVEGSGGALLLRNCDVNLNKVHFVDNRATASGGAVRALSAHPVFVDCEFRDNQAHQGGGAIDASYESIVEISGSRFRGNKAAWGGGASVRNGSVATINHTSFASNIADQYPALGGGLYSDHEAQANLEFCTFTANSALYGGAVSADREAQLTISNCTLRLNLGAYNGGGIYVKAANPVIDHTILAANMGRAIQCAMPGRAPTLSACDLWDNTGGNWDGQIEDQRLVRRNLQVNPLFCGDDDLQLAANSPCAAENSGIGLIGALGIGCGILDESEDDADPDSVTVGEPLVISPNPFNPQTTVSFEVTEPGQIRVRIHDLHGAVVATLVDAVLPRGRHSVPWKGLDDRGRIAASGTYLVSVQTSKGLITRKILVAR
jgi:hypothetical protein